MTTNPTDVLIDADLTALGDANRRDLTVLDSTLRSTGVYRDDRPGAEARRSSLADERRRELAMMPLTLSHLYAHRVARATAGAAAVLCAFALVVVLSDPLLLRLTSWFIPGFALGMYAVIAGATVLGAYVAATWVAEHRFERRMRASIGTGGELYTDLDQLALGPFAVAAQNVRSMDRWAVTLPLAGFATLVPLIGYVLTIAGVWYTMPNLDDSPSLLTQMALTANLGPVVLALAAAVGLTILVGRACDRERRRREAPPLVRWLSHPWTLGISAVLALVTIFATRDMVLAFQAGRRLPSSELRYTLAFLGEAVLVLPATWALLWWRRRERARLGD